MSSVRPTLSRGRLLLLAAVALAIAAAGYSARNSLGIEWNAQSVHALVDRAGWWGPATFIAIFVFRVALLVPSPILLTAGGFCFGPFAGTLYGGLGLTLSALLKFAVAHLAGRDALLARLPAGIQRRLGLAGTHVGVSVLGVATAYPFGSAEILHIAAILAGIGLLPYLLSIGAGSLVRAGAFSVLGSALTDGKGFLVATGALVAFTGLPLLVPSWRRSFLALVWPAGRADGE